MHVHSMYAMMLATDDLESPTSTLCFPESAQMNNNPTLSRLSTCNHLGLINDNYLLPPTTVTDSVDEFITKSLGACGEAATAKEDAAGFNNGVVPHFDSNEDLTPIDGDGTSTCGVHFDENKNYWNSILSYK
ncbi:hypothetical protein CR513_28921, partial [Mucuna pruriens]